MQNGNKKGFIANANFSIISVFSVNLFPQTDPSSQSAGPLAQSEGQVWIQVGVTLLY